ncbi:hypothetical protein [Bacillus sp. Marseille-P3661]|uniref:hypothetical protein n=1 Tax=Bacillus sp. Marseille-P3661 TaxID=1936234 RepID=UPI000C848501|nr:hypothetical protein [Bacillus sp. Marseille-P3661]
MDDVDLLKILEYWQRKYKLPVNTFDFTYEELRRFWDLGGCKDIAIKHQMITKYSEKFNIKTMIETGTYVGDMVHAMKDKFSRIISIELGERLYKQAKKRFSAYPHISIIHGDSGKMLEKILESISEPCLFWLDGHFSFNDTARGEQDTPILLELEHILSHPVRNHVILIDDARCFIGPNPVLNDYPTIQELQVFVKRKRPDLHFEVNEDMICICEKK